MDTAPPEGRTGLERDFRLLLTAGTISDVGDGIDATALPLLAAALTEDPALFAGVGHVTGQEIDRARQGAAA